jgi:hypothetical protein
MPAYVSWRYTFALYVLEFKQIILKYLNINNKFASILEILFMYLFITESLQMLLVSMCIVRN